MLGMSVIDCLWTESTVGIYVELLLKIVMELICWAKSEIAVGSATTTIMYLATTIPTTHPLDEASGIIARQCGSGTISKHK